MRDDILFLEACTLLDTRRKQRAKNKRMKQVYMQQLLTRIEPHVNVSAADIQSGCSAWYRVRSEELPCESKSDLDHFTFFREQAHTFPRVRPFARYAHRVMTVIPVNSFCENLFSTFHQCRSTSRSGLSIDNTEGVLLARNEPDVKSVSLDDINEEIWKVWMVQSYIDFARCIYNH